MSRSSLGVVVLLTPGATFGQGAALKYLDLKALSAPRILEPTRRLELLTARLQGE